MSDAMTNREIEDVLTSIRRLVAQEGTRGAEAGRLILTEAQRVVTDAAPADAGVDPARGATEQGATEQDAAAQDSTAQAGAADSADDDGRVRPGADMGLPEPDFGKLEATIAELEAAVSASGEAWEGEVVEEAPRASNVTELYGRLNFSHRNRNAAPDASSTPDTPGEAASPATAPAVPADESGPSPVVATEVGLPGPEQDQTAAASVDPREPDVTDTDTATVEDGDPILETVIDEATLRALVAQIVREELQGQLGERITLQVRKLVRAEIAKALDERALL
ncbi:MAG: hypothetical protein H6899_00520 [Rhodobacter sp.]|nr:hypothetical protein [Rhodobacter sp.]